MENGAMLADRWEEARQWAERAEEEERAHRLPDLPPEDSKILSIALRFGPKRPLALRNGLIVNPQFDFESTWMTGACVSFYLIVENQAVLTPEIVQLIQPYLVGERDFSRQKRFPCLFMPAKEFLELIRLSGGISNETVAQLALELLER